MSINASLFHVLVVWLVFMLLTVDYVCRGGYARKAITEKQTSKGRADPGRDKFVTQISTMGLSRNVVTFRRDEQNPQMVQNLLTRNTQLGELKNKGKPRVRKTKTIRKKGKMVDEEMEGKMKPIPKKRQRREASSQPSCQFPSFLETSRLCLVSRLTPGKVCKWIHTQQEWTPLFPFHNIVPPYRDWELQVSSSQMRNSDNRYTFKCLKLYNRDKYLIEVTGKSKGIGGENQDYISFLCLKFIPRGLNVIQYMVSENNNVSQNLNCSTEELKYTEQVLISDKYREVPDCPRVLRGAFKLVRVHDAVHNTTCELNPLKTSLLESDCVYKEGIHLDFSAFRDCQGFNNDSNGIRYTRDVLYLRCYSASWKNRGWNYAVVKRDKATRKVDYSNTKMFYCLRLKRDLTTANIKLYIFFDSVCKFSPDEMFSTPYFVFDLVPLTSSLLPTAKQIELEKLRCDLHPALLGQWIEKSAYYKEQTIRIKKQTVELGQDGRFMCMLSDHGSGVGQPFLTDSCDQNIWMERRKISHFNHSYIVISANLPNGCRPRFVGLSVLQGEAASNIYFTYRLSQSLALPIDALHDPILFVQKSLPEKFCSDRDLFRLDPYPHWGRNIEKIAIRPHALASKQTSMDCRFEGPLPNMFSGKLRVNVVDGDTRNAKCSGRIDICTSPTRIHLQYDAPCQKKEANYGCLGRVWDIQQGRRRGHYLLQDLQTHQIYCARSDSGFEIVRAASMQCYEFYWGLAAFQQQFYEEIDILAQGFMECPAEVSTTEVPRFVLEGDVSDTIIPKTLPPQDTNKTRVVSNSQHPSSEANVFSSRFIVFVGLSAFCFNTV